MPNMIQIIDSQNKKYTIYSKFIISITYDQDDYEIYVTVANKAIPYTINRESITIHCETIRNISYDQNNDVINITIRYTDVNKMFRNYIKLLKQVN